MSAPGEPLIGIYLHTVFPLPGWSIRDMGFAGWKAHLDWARSVGFNACMVSPFPQYRLEDQAWSLPERRRLYHGLLAPRPAFGPGDHYYADDPLMSGEEVRRRAQVRTEGLRYAKERGFHTVIGVKLNVGAPTFAASHPELGAVAPSDFCHEGLPLCPSKPASVDHLLALHANLVATNPDADGFAFWARDTGGCECAACQANPNQFLDLMLQSIEVIREKKPGATIYVMSWGYETDEIPYLARSLPKDVVVTEPPTVHYPGRRSGDEHRARIKAWLDAGISVHGWVECQENPTYLLPACYPQRIAEALRVEREAGVRDAWATATVNTFVLPLNLHVFAAMAEDEGDLGDPEAATTATGDFLEAAFGQQALPHALDWAREMEQVWDRLYGTVALAAFGLPLHTVFPASLLPVRFMNEAVPEEVADDLTATQVAAERAVAAAEAVGEAGGWKHHPLDTNVLVISTKLVASRVRFRSDKLPLLAAIRSGDLAAAVRAFRNWEASADDLVRTAASSPNTQYLNTHWTKLELLPERLASLRDHLATLVHMKQVRGLFDDDPLGNYQPPIAKQEAKR